MLNLDWHLVVTKFWSRHGHQRGFFLYLSTHIYSVQAMFMLHVTQYYSTEHYFIRPVSFVTSRRFAYPRDTWAFNGPPTGALEQKREVRNDSGQVK